MTGVQTCALPIYLAVIAFATGKYGLPANLKLSVHSGSDKFSIYAPIRRALEKSGAGIHLKTAGTTWLEELIGLAEAGGDGLDLAVIAFAIRQYGLPATLKLSVHSGSDKFSIYAPIRRALQRFDAGVHLKTAGTTWLEELIGLAEAGGGGLDLAKQEIGRAHV